MTMNSWKSTLESACAPPLRMFIIGTGSVKRSFRYSCPKWRNSGIRFRAASARAAAIETPSNALARLLDGVPSSAIIAWSRPRCVCSRPVIALAISPFTLATARRTPLPP